MAPSSSARHPGASCWNGRHTNISLNTVLKKRKFFKHLIPGSPSSILGFDPVIRLCPTNANSVIGRFRSSAHRAGPCSCPWSVGRHKMRTVEVGRLFNSTSGSWRHGHIRSRPVHRPCSGRLLAIERLDVHPLEPTQAYQLGDAARVVTICLHAHRREGSSNVAQVQIDQNPGCNSGSDPAVRHGAKGSEVPQDPFPRDGF
jgi:hypothetical protein